MKYINKVLNTAFMLALAFCLISCSDDDNSNDNSNKFVNISEVITGSDILSKHALEIIKNDVETYYFNSEPNGMDFVLLTALRTDNVLNSHTLPPAVRGNVLGISRDKDNTKFLIFNDSTLFSTSPLQYPGYFYSQKDLYNDNNYGKPAIWNGRHKDKNITFDTEFQDSIYRVDISNIKNDSVSLASSLYINWQTENHLTAKVTILFDWFPTFADEKYSTNFGELSSKDSGLYMTNLNFLSSLGLPDYGILKITILRYDIELMGINGYRTLAVNAAESSVCLYLKK